MKKAKKILIIVVAVILGLLLVGVSVVYAMFHKELSSITSVKKEQENYYVMDYKADYGLDKFMQTGASTDSELADFIIKNSLKGLPIKIELPDLGCSTFNAETPDGDYIFGRNFDNQDAVYMLVHTKPENGYESISVVNLTFVGYGGDYLPEGLKDSILTLAAPYIPLDGVNEKGLSVGVLQLYIDVTNQETEKVDVTTTSAIRMILDKAATVDEAIALLEEYDMHSSANAPYHFQIADANGDSVTIEYLDNVMYVNRARDGHQISTNFVLTEGKYYNDGYGQDRYKIMRDTILEKDGVLSEEEGMELLSAVAQDKDLDDGTHISTLWSSLYNNTDCTLHLCVGMDYDNVRVYDIHGKEIEE